MLNKKLLSNDNVKMIAESFAVFCGAMPPNGAYEDFVEDRLGDLKKKQKIADAALIELVTKMQNVLPDAKVQPSDKNIRSSVANVLPKIKAFVKKYKYTEETILEATRQYGIFAENNNFQFTSQLHYFIEKSGSSKLVDYCEDVMAGKLLKPIEKKHYSSDLI